MAFDLHEFVVETNLIDRQPSYNAGNGRTYIYPASEPGHLLYDNTVEAFGFLKDLAERRKLYMGVDRDVHRILTRHVGWFEDQGLSGVYRGYDVEVAGHPCPEHWKVEYLMRERWFPLVQSWAPADDQDAEDKAWEAHHLFQCIHPFADGNGRTGRLLLNYFRMMWGLEPMVVRYDQVRWYYDDIQLYRDHDFKGVLLAGGGESWPV